MATSVLRGIVIASLVASLAVISSAQATGTPQIVRLRDSGKTLIVRDGAELQLRLTERYRWLAPRVDGTSVSLTRIDFIRDPGYRAWSVAARTSGKTVVTAVGYRDRAGRTCDPGPCAPHLFRVTFVVR